MSRLRSIESSGLSLIRKQGCLGLQDRSRLSPMKFKWSDRTIMSPTSKTEPATLVRSKFLTPSDAKRIGSGRDSFSFVKCSGPENQSLVVSVLHKCNCPLCPRWSLSLPTNFHTNSAPRQIIGQRTPTRSETCASVRKDLAIFRQNRGFLEQSIRWREASFSP